MAEERRKFIRFDIPLNVELKLAGNPADYLLGVTKDFSREGLSLISQKSDFSPNSTVELKLQLPGVKPTIDISGEVVWAKRVKNKTHLGLKIQEIDKAAKGEILERAYKGWLDQVSNQKNN